MDEIVGCVRCGLMGERDVVVMEIYEGFSEYSTYYCRKCLLKKELAESKQELARAQVDVRCATNRIRECERQLAEMDAE